MIKFSHPDGTLKLYVVLIPMMMVGLLIAASISRGIEAYWVKQPHPSITNPPSSEQEFYQRALAAEKVIMSQRNYIAQLEAEQHDLGVQVRTLTEACSNGSR